MDFILNFFFMLFMSHPFFVLLTHLCTFRYLSCIYKCVICDFMREFLRFACVVVCNKTLTNPFCFYKHVCLRHGNDSCSATDGAGGVGCMGEVGRAVNKERVKYLPCLTCRPRAMEKNRQLLECIKASD